MNAEQQTDNVPAIRPAYFPINELTAMAKAFADSEMFGFKTPAQALSILLIAQAEGTHPATAMQDYDVIGKKPARKTHSVLARFQQTGGRIQWEELNDKRAAAVFTHPASPAPLKLDWTIEMAQKVMIESWDNSPGAAKGAKIKTKLTDKENWQNYPRAMLRARLIAEGVRATYPAAIGGMLVQEEAQDLGDAIEGTATRVEEPKSRVEMPKAKAEDLQGTTAEPNKLAQEQKLNGTAAGSADGQTVTAQEQTTQADARPMIDNMKRVLRATLNRNGLTEVDLKAKFGRTLDESWAFGEFNVVDAWARDNRKVPA